MKKQQSFLLVTLFLPTIVALISCTPNQQARAYGGKQEIKLPCGQKLEMATWKKLDLWILTEPAPTDYIPKTHTFQEHSNFEIWEGTVKIRESACAGGKSGH